MDSFEFTLNNPMTKEDWEKISDVEMEKTERLWFQTPSGRKVEFVPAQRWIPCKERLPEQDGWYLVSLGNEWTKDGFGDIHGEAKIYDSNVRLCEFKDGRFYYGMVAAWMPKPEPYKG